MIYVGIDIAKLNHFDSALSSDGEILIEPFKFTNDNDMASICCFPNSVPLRRATSSLVLNRRHTTVTTLFDTLLPRITKCVFLIPSRLLLCVKTTFAK